MARQVQYLELTIEPDFEEVFSEALHIPHMKDDFPHLRPMMEKMRWLRNLRLLKQVSAFAGVPEAILADIARAAHERSFRKREVIFKRGSKPEALYIVKAGAATLSVGDDTLEEAPAQLMPGALLDAAALLDSRPHSMTARAAVFNTRLLTIPRRDLSALLNQVPEVAERIRANG